MTENFNLISKNLIRNPSGQDGFEGWIVIPENRHELLIIEETPAGSANVPKLDDSEISSNSNCCFATSKEWSSMTYLIDLEAEGLTTNFILSSLPLKFNCSVMYSTPQHLGGLLRWQIKLLDASKSEGPIKSFHIEKVIPHGTNWWETLSHSFEFQALSIAEEDQLKRVCFIEFTIGGKDTKNWPGYNGTKFAHACVTLECTKLDGK